ncbi:MAG: hypothetical protein U0414_22615 [Polyangiaceae bacterium]
MAPAVAHADPAQSPSAGSTPPAAPAAAAALAPRQTTQEIVGRAMAIGGIVTATVGAAVLTTALFSGSATCAAMGTSSACDGTSNDALVVAGAVTLSVGGLLAIGGAIVSQVGPRAAEPTVSAVSLEVVPAPGGAGLALRF